MAHAPSIARLLENEPARIGSFRLIAELGAGGFAPVFLAVEEHGNVELRTVALKLFDTEYLEAISERRGSKTARPAHNQIVEEARALCRVEHPNVVRFYQLVEEGPIVGLAMEHVRGRALDNRIDDDGPLTPEATMEVGRAIAGALAAVHVAGLIHRDVKPGNVIETSNGYKLIDFGIARVQQDRMTTPPHVSVRQVAVVEIDPTVGDDTELTRMGEDTEEDTVRNAAGTMGYIDPVCLSGRAPPDATSDLYALGALLFECLTGRLPASVEEGDATRLRFQIALGSHPPPPVSTIAPHVPAELARLVDSLVAPRREDRPRRAEWVACELERLLLARGRARTLPAAGPFRGLEPFGADDRDIYFGRSADIAQAIELLRTRGVIALVGPSGSGKTSLARAGIAPAIEGGALGSWPATWKTITVSPSSAAGAMDPAGIGDDEGLIVVIDALEELATLGPSEALAKLIDDHSANPRPNVRVILTVRRDLLDPLLEVPFLQRALTRDALLVAPLTGESIVASFAERLAAYDYEVEDEACKKELAKELAEAADSMPLVEFALLRLWKQRDAEKKILPRAAIARIGGIAGALEQHAELTLLEVARDEPIVRALFLALTTPSGTRSRKTPSAIAQEVPNSGAVLAHFENARLIVRSDSALTLAHDALLKQWPRLARWVAETRQERELVAEVETLAPRWAARPNLDALLRGEPLSRALSILEHRQPAFTDGAKEFVRASRRFDLRRKIGLVSLATATVGAAFVFLVLYFQTQREAEVEKAKAKGAIGYLMDQRNTPEAERAKAALDLSRRATKCEHELARCQGDAGN